MLKLISAAQQSRRGTKEMSFLRRLIYHGRYFLRHYPSLFGGGGGGRRRIAVGKLPENNNNNGLFKLRIDGKAPTHNVNTWALPPPLSRSSGGSAAGGVGSSSTLTRIGHEIHSQVRKLFINNVLRRATTNQDVAKKAAQRLLYGDSRPFFALVGVSLATGSAGIVTKESEFDGICWEIRESIKKKSRKEPVIEEDIREKDRISVEELKFGAILSQGCSAAVYSANWADSSSKNPTDEWPLAVKMLFNYDIESNAFAILKGMVKEIVPARRIDLQNLCDLEHSLFANVKRCPPHENIIDVKHAFVDRVPLLPGGIENYPSALPRRLNPDDGFGRNMSLFLVMKRYDTHLESFLRDHTDMKFRTRLLILSQILNGVSHLERSEIAHRDIKTNNILLDLSQGYDLPEVVISDFGCCLADKSVGLSVPFRTYDTDRGGNAALTAPEISTAVPGAWKYLNFKKSDAWSVGAISYEIFGSRNPFYGRSNGHLDSRTYKECDLPNIEGVNHIIQSVIKQLLRRNPEQRMSAEEALYVCMLTLWAPSHWLSGDRLPNDDEILQWLVCLTTKALCQVSNELEYKIIRSFLRKVKFVNLKLAIQWIVKTNNE